MGGQRMPGPTPTLESPGLDYTTTVKQDAMLAYSKFVSISKLMLHQHKPERCTDFPMRTKRRMPKLPAPAGFMRD
jgi:hypothetical protein